MARVDAAEKEASEVLHSLLSVERIEKQEVIVERTENGSPHSFQSNPANSSDANETDSQIQWHTPVSISTHSLFSTIEANNQFQQTMDDQQVIWEGHTIQVDQDQPSMNTIYSTTTTTTNTDETCPESPKRTKPKTSPKGTKKKPPLKKKKKGASSTGGQGSEPTKLEESAVQVKERFKRGCECQDESCFRGLNPESVYKHRLNIAELTKAEHDMYLMGVTMACLANPDETVRHKERRRLRAQYVYQGRRVCLDAFLYLENCTHYQLKRIRKHVMTHGVAPRVHGNHGKKPHNTFSLDIYRHATEFLKQYLETHTGETGIGNSKQPIQLPWDITRKNLHDAYKEYGQILEPGIKLMGYSTFRHFMKEQFPNVKFCKVEPKNAAQHHQQQQQVQEQAQQIHAHVMQKQQIQTIERPREQQIQKSVISNAEVQQVIPLVVTPNDSTTQHHQAAFLVTPVPHQIIQSGNIVAQQNPNGHTASNTFSYQLTNTGYVINEQGNIVTTMANTQHHTPYTFNHAKNTTEEIEMQNSDVSHSLSMTDMVELLQAQFAIITGGKSKEGCPLITFPDNTNFHLLNDNEYQQLMLYLTSVPSLQEADLGFHIIIDRRKDRWNSVKTVLLKISVYFPGLIHVVYVIRPASFLQKALSEVSNKLFKEEFKFRVIILSTVEELHEYIDYNQLTSDLGGILVYSHDAWIQQRIALERFSSVTQKVSHALDEFIKNINETEFPNNVDSTQLLLNQQTSIYSELKEEILAAAKHGEDLLTNVREDSTNKSDCTAGNYPDTIGNVFVVERLLVQLEETERTFDEFWQQHSTKLRHCLELRRFEQDFRELRVNFNAHLKTASEMSEIGETTWRIETLIRETIAFQKLCAVDIERAEEVISSGEQLLKIKNSFPHECVDPKCKELIRIRDSLLEKLDKRMEVLIKCKELIEHVEKSNEWCTKGNKLIASGQVQTPSSDEARQFIIEIEDFLTTVDEFKVNKTKEFKDIEDAPEMKAVIAQALQKVDDVCSNGEKRIAILKTLSVVPQSPVSSEPSLPLCNKSIETSNAISKVDSLDANLHLRATEDNFAQEIDLTQQEIRKAKRGHVLNELLETERIYVTELYSILKGYKMEAQSEVTQSILPPGLLDKLDVIFGNLDELHHFHSEVFLKDIENCITTTDLVALCFVQRRDVFYRLYSYYCQNIPRSEQLRESMVDFNVFFQTCQQKLGHKLPLAAYLLKPVQRITKYQLLLKDLLRYSDETESCKELQQALDCMLVVLRCVNDSMHQISISGFPVDLSQQGDLLLQGSFSVWTENKKDLKLRIKPTQRHIFLYQKAILFCKPTSKTAHNKSTYHFKHYLKMSQIGLTESVKGDPRKFELWLQARQEVHTIQASAVEQKQTWVNEIKRVLLNQLEELKGEKIRQYSAVPHKTLKQTTSWERQKSVPIPHINNHRTMSCDSDNHFNQPEEETIENSNWSSDYSNSDDEEQQPNPAVVSGRYVALADYCAMGNSEVNMKDGDTVELLKVGCAGWWFVKVIGTSNEGWAPAAYLENLHRRTSHSSSRSQERFRDH